MSYRQSTIPTTRRDFSARLLSLSIHNEELEARLRESEQTCQRYEIKIKAQHSLVVDLMDAVHAMANSPSGESDDIDGGSIPEEICVLFTRNAQRVSELIQEVERMKISFAQRIQIPNDEIQESSYQKILSKTNDGDYDDEYEDIPSNISISSLLSSSSSSTTESEEEIAQVKEELISVKSKCMSLQRSVATLKGKNTQREVRSMKSLRTMRWQISELEEERKRRLDLQASAEARVVELENELHELRERTLQENSIFRRQQPGKNHGTEIVVEQNQLDKNQPDSNTEEKSVDDVKFSTMKGVDHCRAMVMLRNKVFRKSEDYYPRTLVTVSEDNVDSEESDDSEDECNSCMYSYLAIE